MQPNLLGYLTPLFKNVSILFALKIVKVSYRFFLVKLTAIAVQQTQEWQCPKCMPPSPLILAQTNW